MEPKKEITARLEKRIVVLQRRVAELHDWQLRVARWMTEHTAYLDSQTVDAFVREVKR